LYEGAADEEEKNEATFPANSFEKSRETAGEEIGDSGKRL
jgi:hypothetical protein